ncbi:hypothetical protein FACS1894200_11400 [Spirochaetia bacterium]|nr:hypothetical protein FACS1894200_11400 [Spirochaetia bacterium]
MLGEKKTSCHYPEFETKLKDLIEPVLRGDPESSLRWVSKSVEHISEL